jgi:hypothetical protein
MAVKAKFRLKGAGRDSYLELVIAFPLASIKSDEQLQEAQKVMDRLLARGALDDGEEMDLDALSDLVAACEDEYYAIEPASDAEMLCPFDGSQGYHAGATEQGDHDPQVHNFRVSWGEETLHPPPHPKTRRLFQRGLERPRNKPLTHFSSAASHQCGQYQ